MWVESRFKSRQGQKISIPLLVVVKADFTTSTDRTFIPEELSDQGLHDNHTLTSMYYRVKEWVELHLSCPTSCRAVYRLCSAELSVVSFLIFPFTNKSTAPLTLLQFCEIWYEHYVIMCLLSVRVYGILWSPLSKWPSYETVSWMQEWCHWT